MSSFQEPVRLLQSVIELLEERTDGTLSSLERDVVRQRLIQVYEMLWDQQQPDTLNIPVEQETKEEAPVVQTVSLPEDDQVPDPEPQKEMKIPEPEPEVISVKKEETPPQKEEKPPVSDDKKTNLNERFAGDKTTLADKILKPQGLLKNLIDVNEKFFFTRELFDGDRKAFEQAIEQLDACTGLEQAIGIINTDLATRYHWDTGSKAVDKFMKEILLRFSR
ncbi:MAG TPA: hypothetical protein PKX04_00575 [Chitinophagales bacterium]|nr:hypothetical protein [Bacteroidota bacterium]HPE96428.1 hypothetical protein [Chitinophagales bacterium]HQU40583.1 hypothetical protein [Chitinophagales bacterium]HRX22605.1 hypothetical protein [Chitinophagales bacterium]